MLTGNYLVALLIGLSGSVHCVGMCGPLVFGIPSAGKSWRVFVADKLLYNLGRVITYTFLGFLLGQLGLLAWLAGMQQALSITSGIIVIIAGVVRLLKLKGAKYLPDVSLPFYRLINIAIKRHAGHLLLGMLNGLLPCGFVYIALFGALNTTEPLHAALFMLFFGLGTIPLMLTAALSAKALGPAVRRRLNYTMPFLIILLGAWFMLRGAGLNIPYLSPQVKTVGVSVCH
ncbi:sulfite exporter TauE/SafE family protein [Mucilaginibacter sp. 44-25]|uniref:sulfite exporter TauE/SafE family protein n=1 Tax=Mucilaginibacter sp. 44-25 TaxID=1895794 RepID=UPI00096445E3|nr:sulfite exporter TauE/SafE family protein [Mucilaginibacter sp. 44-25]OJW13340.1 MAG: hypothetical protein BGO48_00865 [Mucilaginibacter sp. 44-25]